MRHTGRDWSSPLVNITVATTAIIKAFLSFCRVFTGFISGRGCIFVQSTIDAAELHMVHFPIELVLIADR
jgi:hypothetical protein